MKQQKRYQYYSPTGIQWTPWFDFNGQQEPWQLKSQKLKNEYRIVQDEDNN